MLNVFVRLFLLIIVFMSLMTLNFWLINGPLLHSNTALSQFHGVAATAGDFNIYGYYVPFGVIYPLEVGVLVLTAILLFRGKAL